jgi:glycosyltransferase involved in cell wall biosynthesis
MKIFYFTPFYPPQGEAAATRNYWFVRTLREENQVEVYSSVKVSGVHELFLKTASNKAGLLTRLIMEILVGIELFLRILFNSSELFVFSSPPFFTCLMASWAVRIKGQRYIADIRDLYPEVFFEMKVISRESLPGKMLKTFARSYYYHAHNIITVTEGLKKYIGEYGFSKKVHLIRNGYDNEIFYPSTSGKFPKFSLVFHGTLGKAQNIKTLLDVAKRLESHPEMEILVAGDGPKLEELLRANRPNIRYLGILDYQAIPQILRQCHVGLSFRTDDMIGKEAFPVKVFEYVGCGLPVILTPKGEASDIIEERGLGKGFENSEIEAIFQEIEAIWASKRTYQTSQEFSRKNSSQQIKTLL